MPEKNMLGKCSAVIQWVSSLNGSSPRSNHSIPTCIRMGNGVELPFMGLGTGGFPSSEEDIERSIREALNLGYTHIDTSTDGTEEIIGRVLKEYFESGKLTRQDVFITTKLPCASHHRPDVEQSLRKQLKDLQLDYVDLYLINTPCGVRVFSTAKGLSTSDAAYTSLPDTWKGMEDVYNKKLARSIGISNFNVDQIQKVYSSAEIKPHNLQVEVHLHWPQKELVVLCQSLNVCLTAYAPIGSPAQRQSLGIRDSSPLEEPLVRKLAEKYQKTPAQILLRHLTQRNIVVIPKSTNVQHLKENLDSMKFSISDEDMIALGRIKPHRRIYTLTHRRHHPEFPFCDVPYNEKSGSPANV